VTPSGCQFSFCCCKFHFSQFWFGKSEDKDLYSIGRRENWKLNSTDKNRRLKLLQRSLQMALGCIDANGLKTKKTTAR